MASPPPAPAAAVPVLPPPAAALASPPPAAALASPPPAARALLRSPPPAPLAAPPPLEKRKEKKGKKDKKLIDKLPNIKDTLPEPKKPSELVAELEAARLKAEEELKRALGKGSWP